MWITGWGVFQIGLISFPSSLLFLSFPPFLLVLACVFLGRRQYYKWHSPLYLSYLMSPWCMWPASRPSDPTLSRCSMWLLCIPMKRFCCWASQHRMVTCSAFKISFCSWREGRDTCGHGQGPKKPSSGQAILLQKTLTLRRTHHLPQWNWVRAEIEGRNLLLCVTSSEPD